MKRFGELDIGDGIYVINTSLKENIREDIIKAVNRECNGSINFFIFSPTIGITYSLYVPRLDVNRTWFGFYSTTHKEAIRKLSEFTYFKNKKFRIKQKRLKNHFPHSRDFSHELGK